MKMLNIRKDAESEDYLISVVEWKSTGVLMSTGNEKRYQTEAEVEAFVKGFMDAQKLLKN